MKILYTTPILEYPAAGGPQLRIENSIKALARVCDLHIIHRASYDSPDVRRTDAYFSQFGKSYITTYDYPRLKPIRLLFKIYRRVLRFLGKTKDSHINSIINHIQNENIDVVWFGYGNISYKLIKDVKDRFPHVKAVCDTDSVWSRFVLRELPFAEGKRKEEIQRLGSLKEAEERAWVGLCDVTTAVSEIDAQYYRSLAFDPSRIHIFSNVIDINNYAVVPPRPIEFKMPCVFLAGSYGPNSAMNMAAQWVLDEVLPIVRKTHPNLHFYLVGRDSDSQFGHIASNNVTVTGKLETVLPYLCNANVALVPLKFESGTRFKILEAGACRIPLVSTTLGAEGIPVKDGRDILIADDPQGFAQSIIRIIDDPYLAKSIADSCFELVNSKYSVESLVGEAKNIMAYLNNEEKKIYV
jgi:glycosyltransferase involved in cell wall biosynthesis